MTNNLSPHDRKVFVWDWPTRIFHWGLLVLIVVTWIAGTIYSKPIVIIQGRYQCPLLDNA